LFFLFYAEKHRTRKGAMRREFALKNDPQIPGGVAGQIAASGLPLIALKPMLTNVRFAPKADNWKSLWEAGRCLHAFILVN